MKTTISFLAALLLAGSLGAGAARATTEEVLSKEESLQGGDAGAVSGSNGGAEGILLKEPLAPGSNVGHLRFPAIREETLSWDRPVLKDPSSGDIIDFYGPLDHDPLGEEEIRTQKNQLRRYLDD
jgi:hypothetical protein